MPIGIEIAVGNASSLIRIGHAAFTQLRAAIPFRAKSLDGEFSAMYTRGHDILDALFMSELAHKPK